MEKISLVRNTRQRAAVSDIIATQEGFRTAQQIHEELRKSGHKVGLTTVYRNLQTLADSGEVDVLRNPDGELSYRRCSDAGHHHHLVCRSCGKTVEVSGETVEKWALKVGKEYGFREVGHDLEFFGLCADC
ncbi:MAG: Fur family transcriptional regulator [Propionibacteriaceae bacterium]